MFKEALSTVLWVGGVSVLSGMMFFILVLITWMAFNDSQAQKIINKIKSLINNR